MAKKRKTRQEKIIADLRRQLRTQEPPQPAATTSIVSTYSLPQAKPIVRPSANTTPSSLRPDAYAYVISDLKKTMLFTFIAIAAQVGLYLVLAR